MSDLDAAISDVTRRMNENRKLADAAETFGNPVQVDRYRRQFIACSREYDALCAQANALAEQFSEASS